MYWDKRILKWKGTVEHNRMKYHLGYHTEKIVLAHRVNAKCAELGIKLKNPHIIHDRNQQETSGQGKQ